MAEYGFRAVNDSGTVTISSVYKALVFSERGTIRVTSSYTDRGGVGQTSFIRPITTQEAPQLFVRVQSASHASLGVAATLLGGPGNWTGIRIDSAATGSSPLQNFVLEYVSCKFADNLQVSGYGMNIRDASGLPVFSAKDKVVRYNKFATVWTLAQDVSTVRIWTPNVTIDADDFICVSAMDRGVNWFAENSQFAGFNIWSASKANLTLYVQRITALGFWYWQGSNNTQFTVPVCKFPIDRYFN
ncbi:MAG TPA: hypothetical protein VJS90_06885 [Pseudomonas sp.]|uniref:hypothetical protein n=1 Tax=Pseudomonas sp. TaxID=306 RepID=UPI002B49EF10|nr:hypothetical protein [Pseudomonas sp.]HKS12750.1 hypothetical protein [Pseudomonas sp.]